MTIAETMPALTFLSNDIMRNAAQGELLCLAGEDEIWRAERDVICNAFDELMALLQPN
jgi:hypothetical protein